MSLAIDEIRHFGASSMQVARRLRAFLDDLLALAPEERKASIRLELRHLEHFDELSSGH